jgi:hypothetical protein
VPQALVRTISDAMSQIRDPQAHRDRVRDFFVAQHTAQVYVTWIQRSRPPSAAGLHPEPTIS